MQAERALGPEGEEGWLRLRTHLEWADAPWLGVVLTPSPGDAEELVRRVADECRARARPVRVFRPAAPEELLGLVPKLVDPTGGPFGATVVLAVHRDPEGRGPWEEGWAQLLLRLNSVRDRALAASGGAVLLVAHPSVREVLKDAAPDLWSVRALTVTLTPQPLTREGPRPEAFAFRRPEDHPAPDPVLARREVARLEGKRGKVARAARARARVREAEGLLARGDVQGAWDAAMTALTEAVGEVRADALEILAEADVARQDPASAIAHLQAALQCARTANDAARWLRLGDLRFEVRDLAPAREAFLAGLESAGRAYEGEAMIAYAWTALAKTSLELGDRPNALASSTTAVESARRSSTERPGPLADRLVAGALVTKADALEDAGDAADAVALLVEALERLGLHSVRDRLLVRQRLGAALHRQGRHPDAILNRSEAIRLARELLGQVPPHERLDARELLASSLGAMGDSLEARGFAGPARARWQEAIVMLREVVDAGGGEAPLWDLAITLDRVARSWWGDGDRVAALAAAVESLSCSRRLHATRESVRHLRRLSEALFRVSSWTAERSPTERLALLDEAIEVTRRLIAETSEPEASERLARCLEQRAQLLDETGDPSGALRDVEEGVVLARGLLGSSPEVLAQLLERLGALLQARGDEERAREIQAERASLPTADEARIVEDEALLHPGGGRGEAGEVGGEGAQRPGIQQDEAPAPLREAPDHDLSAPRPFRGT